MAETGHCRRCKKHVPLTDVVAGEAVYHPTRRIKHGGFAEGKETRRATVRGRCATAGCGALVHTFAKSKAKEQST
jgi:hypothetical protein